MKVKVNNKSYEVPELTFKHFTLMEEQGFSVVEAFNKKQAMLLSMGFVCIVANVERDEAEHLIEQHVLGGGKIADIVNSFFEAASNSGFFRKMLGMEKTEKEKKPEKKETAEEDQKNEVEPTEE